MQLLHTLLLCVDLLVSKQQCEPK